MLIVKKSILTGKIHERELDVTPAQINRWTAGGLVQDVFPHLSADDREFLVTGSTPEEWDAAFGEDWDIKFGEDE